MNRTRPFRYLLLAGLLTGLFALWAGCSSNNNSATAPPMPPTPGADTVFMWGNTFIPDSMEVAIGTEVTWVNKESVVHQVHAGTPSEPDSSFESLDMSEDMSFTYEFTHAGTFRYYDPLHADSMQGVIVTK